MGKMEWATIFGVKSSRGEGFIPYTVDGILIKASEFNGDVSVYDAGDKYVIIGTDEAHGPWAVDLIKEDINGVYRKVAELRLDLKYDLNFQPWGGWTFDNYDLADEDEVVYFKSSEAVITSLSSENREQEIEHHIISISKFEDLRQQEMGLV